MTVGVARVRYAWIEEAEEGALSMGAGVVRSAGKRSSSDTRCPGKAANRKVLVCLTLMPSAVW